MNVTRQVGRGAIALALLLGAASSAHAQLSGAIFTTLQDGTRVNANIYQAKCGVQGVWLDGGPGPNAPQGAAGLPDGDYYFQVTDPSGKTLLSTDPVINRQFHVANGIISGLSGAGNHNTGLDVDHGATTVELCPFLDTPNPGGVYKVWVTPTSKFSGNPAQVDNRCGNGCFHGFVPAASKSDNFKVKGGASGTCLEMLKIIDVNGDGYGDPATDYLVNWPVMIVDPIGTSNIFWTPTTKECTFAQLVPGTYTVTEYTDPNFAVTINILDGQYLRNPSTSVSVRIRTTTREVVFGNTQVQ